MLPHTGAPFGIEPRREWAAGVGAGTGREKSTGREDVIVVVIVVVCGVVWCGDIPRVDRFVEVTVARAVGKL